MSLRSDELMVEIRQKPSSKEVDSSPDGWIMLRARVSNESDSSIAFIGCSSGGQGVMNRRCGADDECAAMNLRRLWRVCLRLK